MIVNGKYNRLAGLGLICCLQGCAVSQLDDFKDLALLNNYAEIAAQEVDCNADDSGCDQLRLIHGNACYVVAKQNNHASDANLEQIRASYLCAIKDLQLGIDFSGQSATTHQDLQPYYLALMESTSELQGLTQGVGKYTGMLRDQSAKFRESYPEQAAGYYYGATADFMASFKPGITRKSKCDYLAQAAALVSAGREFPGYQENFDTTALLVTKKMQRDCNR